MIFLIAGLTGSVIFLWPALKRGIWNIGNQTGLALSFFMVLWGAGLWYRLGAALWRCLPGRLALGGLAVLAAGIFLLAAAETVLMIKAAVKKPPEDAAVVVLGCKLYGSRVSLTLKTRLDAARRYLETHPGAVCIVSGGQGNDEPISEAASMQKYLLEKGVAPERIYLEDRSVSTRENLRYSLEIMRKLGLKNELAIATSEFHQYRAGCIAEALQLHYGAISGRTPLLLLPTFYIRELYGILYQWMKLKKPEER